METISVNLTSLTPLYPWEAREVLPAGPGEQVRRSHRPDPGISRGSPVMISMILCRALALGLRSHCRGRRSNRLCCRSPGMLPRGSNPDCRSPGHICGVPAARTLHGFTLYYDF
jgi:hypothetical protein